MTIAIAIWSFIICFWITYLFAMRRFRKRLAVMAARHAATSAHLDKLIAGLRWQATHAIYPKMPWSVMDSSSWFFDTHDNRNYWPNSEWDPRWGYAIPAEDVVALIERRGAQGRRTAGVNDAVAYANAKIDRGWSDHG